MRPLLCSSDDVARTIEEGCRARVISQLVETSEEYVPEFASSFQSATEGTEPAQLLTSHAKRQAPTDPQPHRKVTVPAYPSVVQSLRWNPYVEMSSANNSRTDIVMDRRTFNCKCESCAVKTCPSKVFKTDYGKPRVFKDNVMTFADRCTMTPRLNDVCCGACAPAPAPAHAHAHAHCAPPPSTPCLIVRDTETETYTPNYCTPKCAPIPILKRSEYSEPTCAYGYCGQAAGHLSAGIRHEAVRDTDLSENYCEPSQTKLPKSFMKFKKKHLRNYAFCENGRRILYNEGISDDVAHHIEPARVPSPIDVSRGCSKVSVRSRCFMDDDVIPHSHKGVSKYHQSCKKPTVKSYYCSSDTDEVRHMVESPRIAKKALAATTKLPARAHKTPKSSLPRSPPPRKVLTSEADIDAYVDKSLPAPAPPEPVCRRTRSKRFF